MKFVQPQKLLYLAGPWFTPEQEKVYGEVIDHIIQMYGDKYKIFIPRYYKVPDGENMANHEWGQAVCGHDTHMLENADLVFAIDWGFNADAGTAFEVGFAAARCIRTILYVPHGVDTVSCMLHGHADEVLDGDFNKCWPFEKEWK